MSYATVQDMITRYGVDRLIRLTDRANPPAGVVDNALLQSRLDDATAEIDGYLIGRYALPLPVFPAVLKLYCGAIAMYLLLADGAKEAAVDDYKTAIAYLNRVATGAISLLPPDVAAQPAGAGQVLFSPGSKVMGRDGDDLGSCGSSAWG